MASQMSFNYDSEDHTVTVRVDDTVTAKLMPTELGVRLPEDASRSSRERVEADTALAWMGLKASRGTCFSPGNILPD